MNDLTSGNNLYRSCLSKKAYWTYKHALKIAKKYTKKYGKQQYVYWCPYCFRYHLTSSRRDNRNKGEPEIYEAMKEKEDNK